MVDRKLIAALLTIAIVLVSELVWPNTKASLAEINGARSGSAASSPDWSAVLRAHRDTVRAPRPADLPDAFGPMVLPFSLVTLLKDGTQWEVHGAGSSVSAWTPLAASTVEVNNAEGYVIAEFAEAASAVAEHVDGDEDTTRTATAGVAHRGLQTLACEEYGGASGSTSASPASSPSSAAASSTVSARRRARGASAAKITGRCFLTLDDPSDVMSEEKTVAFTYEVASAKASEKAGSSNSGATRTGAAAARKSRTAASSSSSASSDALSEAGVLEGASGWLQLEREVDTDADRDGSDGRAARQTVGAVLVREGVTRRAEDKDGSGGFKATIQLYFFPTEDTEEGDITATSATALAPLFPRAVELTGVHGSWARVAEQQQHLAKKAAVTSLWGRYVVPVLLAIGVYAAARVLNVALVAWLDRQQKQKEAAAAAAAPAGAPSAPQTKPAVRA